MIFHNKIKKATISCLLILIMYQAYSENIMFNSGFEQGNAGYQCVKYLRPDTNPNLKYEGPVADASTHVSGKQSLKIPNRFAEAINFSSYYAGKIKPKTKYTLSVWVKTSVDDYPVVLLAKSSTRWVTFARRTVNAGEKWTRYMLNFKSDEKSDYLKISILCGKESTPCDIWLDDLEVTADDVIKDKKNATGIEGYTRIDKLFIQNGKLNDIPATADIINNLSKKVSFKLGVNVINRYTGIKVFNKNISVSFLPDEKKNIKFTIPADIGCGSYIISLFIHENIKNKFMPSLFAVAGEYISRPVDLDKTFCMGFNETPITITAPPWTVALPGVKIADGIASASPISEKFDLAKKMGCRLLRLWGPGNIRWSEIEPEEGKFNFIPIDRMLSYTEKYDINVLLVLGNMDFIDINTGKPYVLGSLPEWLKSRCSIREKFPLKKKYTKGKVYLPPSDLWKKYVKKIATHCKGKISHYEIMNEPNLIFSKPEEYLNYARTAWKAVKESDKVSRLVGPGVTGDLGGSPASFLGKYIVEGGLDYVNIVSFHPYNARELSSRLPADKQIKNFEALCEKFNGKKYPLWNTELYYLAGPDSKSFNKIKASKPYHLARRILTDLGEGVKQSIDQPLWAVWDSQIHPDQMEYPNLQQVPSDVYVTINTLARYFEGAEPVSKIRWSNNNICYIYKRDNKYLAAYWNYRKTKTNTIKLKTEVKDSFELYDMFGNKLKFNGKSLPIGDAPRYLISKTTGGIDELVSALKSAEIVEMK